MIFDLDDDLEACGRTNGQFGDMCRRAGLYVAGEATADALLY